MSNSWGEKTYIENDKSLIRRFKDNKKKKDDKMKKRYY